MSRTTQYLYANPCEFYSKIFNRFLQKKSSSWVSHLVNIQMKIVFTTVDWLFYNENWEKKLSRMKRNFNCTFEKLISSFYPANVSQFDFFLCTIMVFINMNYLHSIRISSLYIGLVSLVINVTEFIVHQMTAAIFNRMNCISTCECLTVKMCEVV